MHVKTWLTEISEPLAEHDASLEHPKYGCSTLRLDSLPSNNVYNQSEPGRKVSAEPRQVRGNGGSACDSHVSNGAPDYRD